MEIDLVELERRLSCNDNVLNRFDSVEFREGTNRPGRKNYSEDTKELIGTLAHLDTQENVARAFGMSQENVSNIKRGMNSSGSSGEFNPDRKSRIDKNISDVVEVVRNKALTKLEAVLEGITEDKIKVAKVGELAMAASNLGKLGIGERDEVKTNTQNNFVFYSPRQKDEDEYKIINVA